MGLWKRLKKRIKRKRRSSSSKKRRRVSRKSRLRKLLKKSGRIRFRKSKTSNRKKRLRKVSRSINKVRSMRKIKRPKNRVKSRSPLTAQQKRKALEFRNRKRLRTFKMREKSEAAKDAGNQKIEDAKVSVLRKQGRPIPKNLQEKPSISREQLMYELRSSLTDEFKEHGREAPPYSGTITEILSPNECKVDVSMTMEQLQTGFLWRDFTIKYPVKESVEISGQELEEKDLVIGEQEFDIEQKTIKLEDIRTRSEELVTRVLQFFALNGFLTGSLDETALLSMDQEKTIKNVTNALKDAQDKFTITAQHSASMAAIHKNIAGCQPPGSLENAPPVIPVFEYYNENTDDYHYSTDFEWRLSQDSGQGWVYRTILKGGWQYQEGGVFGNQFEDVVAGKGGGLGGQLKVQSAAPINLNQTNGKNDAWNGKMAINYGGESGDNVTHCYEWFWQPTVDGEYVFRASFDDVGWIDVQGKGGEWRRLIDDRYSGWSGENATTEGTADPVVVTKTDIKNGRKWGMRMVVSEYKGAHSFQIQEKNNTNPVEYTVEVPIKKKKWRKKKWWKGRKTVIVGYRTEKRIGKSFLDMSAGAVHLCDPTNYRRAGTAFGAYDPMLAEHLEAKQHVKINKWSSFQLGNSEPFKLAGKTTKKAEGGDPSRAGEAVGTHYIGEKPPKNHKVKKDLWGDMGCDFAALKANLPMAHPKYREVIMVKDGGGEEKEVVVEEGKTLPVHRFYNKDKGTYRFKILPDGRTRQARTPEGILKTNEQGIPIMEKLDMKVGTENTLDLAGGDNAASFQKDFTGNNAKFLPPSVVGEGFEWEGIAFYAFEPPGIPPNKVPVVQIYIKKKLAPENYQTRAKWESLDKRITLTTKAHDEDGKIMKYTWKIEKQTSDVRSIKPRRPGVVGREASIKMDFPIGKTTISVEVEDNRGDIAKDKIDVIVLAPKKSDWRAMIQKDFTDLNKSKLQVPYYYHRRRRWRRDVRKTVNVDQSGIGWHYYELGFKDGKNGNDVRSTAALDRYRFPFTRTVDKKVKVGRKKKFKLWRGRRWVDIYKTVKEKQHYTISGKDFSSHNRIRKHFSHVRSIGKSEADIDQSLKAMYNLGYNHATKGPHYLIDNDLAMSIRVPSKSKRRRKSVASRLRPPKRVRKRIKKMVTPPKQLRRAITPPKKLRKRLKKAGRKIRKFFKRWSDMRLKVNVNYIQTSKSGINIYEYNYIWGSKKYRGVMAQELLDSHPSAIGKRLGYYTVDYDQLDVNFERVDG